MPLTPNPNGLHTSPPYLLAVRYAKPPIGDLRFKRPEEFPAWSGVMDATKIGVACPQKGFSSTLELSKTHFSPIIYLT